ncbi:glutathione S-transferase [Lichenicola sp.]|uniref:glutathione S-transferase n=1 Tax=Lichenicola sp. TaxID=2804529 RepID=UPI003B00D5B4
MTITVHHLNESRSQRVLLLLEELGVPYEVRRYERNRKTMLAPDALKSVHPLGKSPLVVDDDLILAESGHIIDSLIDRYGAGRLRPPPGTPDRDRYGFFLHYAEGSLAPLMLLSLVFSRLPRQMPFPLRPVARLISRGLEMQFLGPQLATHLDFLEAELSGRPWFAGNEFTGADAIMSFPLQAMLATGRLEDHPRLRDWVQRLESRPAWARAVERGGPLTFRFR